MRCVLQRVSSATCTVGGRVISSIGRGMVVFLAIGAADSEHDLELIARKILKIRIFEDAAGKMNLDIRQIEGAVLLISQFTLYGDARKGNRPSFIEAAPPERARQYYEAMAERLRREVPVQTGVFREMMDIGLINNGPVTILLDSQS